MTNTAEKLADLRRRLEKAQDPGSERARAKRDEAGRTTPRQRINALLDDGSFMEVGALGKTPGDDDAVYSDGVVTGYGRIGGRPVCIYAHDKTVYGGSVGVTFGQKVTQVIKEVTGEEVSSAELGGARQQERNGNVQAVVDSEEDAFELVRDLLDHLPLTCHDPAPSFLAPSDEEVAYTPELDEFMPDDTNAGYDIIDVLKLLGDDDQLIELQANFAPNMVTAFGRIDGQAVGFVANNPMHFAGCIDADAADKGARFIRICDAYNIPLIFVADTPGYLPGVEQEKAGLIHRGAGFAFALVEATVPKISLVVRKAYGGAYAVMGSKNLSGDINFAWPTAQIAVMGAAAAVVMIQGKQLEQTPPEQRGYMKKVFMDFYDENMTSPYVAAERGYIDAMIQPSETRLKLRQALRQLATKHVEDLPKKHPIAPM